MAPLTDVETRRQWLLATVRRAKAKVTKATPLSRVRLAAADRAAIARDRDARLAERGRP